MKLRVERQIFSPFSTIGELTVDGAHECWTLEPVWTTADIKPRAIPEGTYFLRYRLSPAHGRPLPHVENVPGFEEIEIHVGNFPQDTKGCTLVGRIKGGPDFVGGSGLAFNDLWRKLLAGWQRDEAIEITYVNGAQI